MRLLVLKSGLSVSCDDVCDVVMFDESPLNRFLGGDFLRLFCGDDCDE